MRLGNVRGVGQGWLTQGNVRLTHGSARVAPGIGQVTAGSGQLASGSGQFAPGTRGLGRGAAWRWLGRQCLEIANPLGQGRQRRVRRVRCGPAVG